MYFKNSMSASAPACEILVCISTFIEITQEVMFSSEIPMFS